MQKNPGENFTTVEVDPVTGEYVIQVPEWIISEYGWVHRSIWRLMGTVS
jgi:hypothetical protein